MGFVINFCKRLLRHAGVVLKGHGCNFGTIAEIAHGADKNCRAANIAAAALEQAKFNGCIKGFCLDADHGAILRFCR